MKYIGRRILQTAFTAGTSGSTAFREWTPNPEGFRIVIPVEQTFHSQFLVGNGYLTPQKKVGQRGRGDGRHPNNKLTQKMLWSLTLTTQRPREGGGESFVFSSHTIYIHDISCSVWLISTSRLTYNLNVVSCPSCSGRRVGDVGKERKQSTICRGE